MRRTNLIVSTLVFVCGAGLREDVAATSYDDDETELVRAFASDSAKTLLDFRLKTGDRSLDPVLREYLKIQCGGPATADNPVLPWRTEKLMAHIDESSIEELLDLRHYAPDVTVTCGCFAVKDRDWCGSKWDMAGMWTGETR